MTTLHVSQYRNASFLREAIIFAFALVIVFVSAGCRNMEKSEDQHFNKLDAPLRLVIFDREENNPDSLVYVLIELISAPDENLSKFFDESDLKITTISGNILAANGKASAIRKIAGSEAVVSISLSQERGLHR